MISGTVGKHGAGVGAHIAAGLSRLRSPESWGTLGLYGFAFFVFLDVAQANQALLILLVALLVQWRKGRGERRRAFSPDRLLLVSLLFLVFLTGTTLLSLFRAPNNAALILVSAKDWPLRGFFALLLVAFWISRLRTNPARLLAVCFSGLFVRVLLRWEWHAPLVQLQTFWDGTRRATFGYSAINLGIWATILLLGLILFMCRLLGSRRAGERLPPMAAGAALLCVPAGCLIAFSQARSAWLVCLVVIPAALAASLFMGKGAAARKRGLAAVLLLLALAAPLGCSDLFNQRLAMQRDTIVKIFRGEFNNLEKDPISIRWQMYRHFLASFPDHPFIGGGPGSAVLAVRAGGFEPPGEKPFSHFHSSYFNVLFEFGLVGFSLILLFYAEIIAGMLNSYRRGLMAPELFLFLVGSFAIIALGALINEPFCSTNGPYFISLWGGIAHGTRRTQTNSCPSGSNSHG